MFINFIGQVKNEGDTGTAGCLFVLPAKFIQIKY